MNKEVKEKIERVFDMFEGSFIHKEEELVLHKRWNVYFRLPDLKSPEDFDYKLLSYLSFYTASHHFTKLSKECKWALSRLNRWFRTEFNYDDLQIIYQKLGSGANRELGNKFIKSGLNMEVLKK